MMGFGLLAALLAVSANLSETPRARFGIMSDVHLDGGFFDKSEHGPSSEVFRGALKIMDARQVDGVVIAGDLTRIGQIAELKEVASIWNEVFPKNRRSDGETVEPLFIYGDHEVETFDSPGQGYEKMFKANGMYDVLKPGDIAVNDRAKQWQAAFGEPFAPIRRRTVKGYDFVLAHFQTRDEPGMRPGDPTWVPGLEEFFATNSFDTVKPFFYVQHKLPKGTVGGPTQTGRDSGRTTALLSNYPNAVGFCGHKHRAATEELSLWQGAFTQILVPAVRGLLTDSGRENSRCSCEPTIADPPQQMERLAANGSQALVMSVYDDRLVFERIDLLHGGEAMSEPWVVKWPIDGSSSYARRCELAGVPEFASDAKVTARCIRGKVRGGKDDVDQIEVRFPVAALTATTPRAYDYEVTAVLTKGSVRRIVSQKRVYSPRLFQGERFDVGEVVCVFGRSEISDNHDSIVFEVRPANAWGKVGKAIGSEPGKFYARGPQYSY